MPSSETFSIEPIRLLLARWIKRGDVVIDPFARDSKVGTITNDLNPKTTASYHLDACAFLDRLIEQGTEAHVALFDPPYSPRQIQECYEGVGRKMSQSDAHHSALWGEYKSRIDRLVVPGGLVISCGWNTQGMGRSRGYRFEEILIVAHGSCHNDTLVTVERKMQAGLGL